MSLKYIGDIETDNQNHAMVLKRNSSHVLVIHTRQIEQSSLINEAVSPAEFM
jgi:hypothetical protein